MPTSATNSALTTRLFLESIEVDLDANIDIANTYAISDVKEIGAKQSQFTKSITLPGTARNNKLFGFLYDIKSVGTQVDANIISGRTLALINGSSGSIVITGANFNGANLSFPINPGNNSELSFHNQISNEFPYMDISGQTDGSGYIISTVNNVVIAVNSVRADTSRYYFPSGFYLFTDQLIMTVSDGPLAVASNIGYDLDFKKKMRATVVQDNTVILSGYAKIISATQTDGLIKFTIQITSDLGGFISSLANLRLEDLYTTIAPDLDLDPTGQTAKVIDLISPYDHFFNLVNVNQSWFGLEPYVYPLIDYGNDDTVFQTNFYTSVLRPCLHAKDYLDLIFLTAGYTYDSAFLNSDYFKNLIIPYKDGNISIIDLYKVEVSNSENDSTDVIPDVVEAQDNSFYIFDQIITDTYGIYDTSTFEYMATVAGTYAISGAIQANFILDPSGAGSNVVGCPQFTTYVLFEVFPASGGTDPVNTYITLYDQPQFGVTVAGNPAFVGSQTSDNFLITIASFPVYVAEAGSTIRCRISPTAPHQTAGTFFPDAATPSTTYAGSALFNVPYDPSVTGAVSILNIQYSELLDNQYLRFKDFVPKSVKQIDYVNSIIKLFNLYPVQDRNRRNHFNIFTRDEFYSNQNTLDWTKKIDLLSDVTVSPIPELDSSQLLFSYKEGTADWFNKQYNSLYGNYSYGSLRVQTGYDFANKVDDVLDGVIFEPTPLVQMGVNSYPSESSVEILNTLDIVTFPNSDNPTNIIMASGYYAANGSLSPYKEELSVPVSNNFSGSAFTRAKVGVHILYWGIEYIISSVFNDYAFQVVDVNGNDTVLYRPVTQGTDHRINDTYYATNDGFTYITNSNVVIPAIYDSSDNNVTHKPVTTEMKILYFQPLTEFSQASYNPVFLQYTPVVQNGIFTYQRPPDAVNTDPGIQQKFQYPYCGHLNDPIAPDFDLNFGQPIALFFGFPYNGSFATLFHISGTTEYPTANLYTRFWVNTANEITDDEAKFVDCMMNLSSVDISTLDLSNKIYINGTNFRINKVEDYTPDGSITKVELIRIPKFTNTNTNIFVFAGVDQILSGDTTSEFSGVARPGNNGFGGEIVSIEWTQLSGPTATITTPSSLESFVTDLIEGDTYIFQLKAVDNIGNIGIDTMQIIVVSGIPCLPTVTAEADPDSISLAIEDPSTTLVGTAEGCGGGEFPLRLLFTSISAAPVSPHNSVSGWNTFFNTSANADSPFTGADVIGDEVFLTGASNLYIADSLFQGTAALVRIKDEGSIVSTVGFNCFNTCTSLTEADLPACQTINGNGFLNASALATINIPSATFIDMEAFAECPISILYAPGCVTVGAGAFSDCFPLISINLASCTNLGGSTGDDSVFSGVTGNAITLTIKAATSTDGDVAYLQANNAVTLHLT